MIDLLDTAFASLRLEFSAPTILRQLSRLNSNAWAIAEQTDELAPIWPDHKGNKQRQLIDSTYFEFDTKPVSSTEKFR